MLLFNKDLPEYLLIIQGWFTVNAGKNHGQNTHSQNTHHQSIFILNNVVQTKGCLILGENIKREVK